MLRQLQRTLSVPTSGQGFVDITFQVREVVREAAMTTGLVTLFIAHTSASLLIQENADPSVLRDLSKWLASLAPENETYEHDDEGPDDMPAHLRAAVTRTSESIPISGGVLGLGRWQAIYIAEHRRAKHTRSIVVHVVGE